MKIKSLEINHIRGIKEMKTAPDGGSMVIYGPNGTGKSALVDAVDFLLTGEITRLTGEGTEGITLKDHGCHIDSRENLKDTSVSAVVDVDGKDVSICRSISSPNSLQVDPKEAKDEVEAYLKVADLGQHILSRRQILSYICAKGGERAKKIQELLNLSQIENIRSTLVSVQTDAGKDFKHADSSYTRTKNDVKVLLGVSECTAQTLLKKINELRGKLKSSDGKRASDIEEDAMWKGEVKEGIKPLYDVDKKTLSVEQIENLIRQMREFLQHTPVILESETKLNELLEKILKDEQYKRQSAYMALLKVGLPLVDEDNVCPLCDRKWDDGNFKEHLLTKKQEIEVNLKEQKEIDELSRQVKVQVESLKGYYENLLEAHTQFGINTISEDEKTNFIENCTAWSVALDDPLKVKGDGKWPSCELNTLLDQQAVEDKVFQSLETAIKKSGVVLSEQQKAWDTLTKLEDVLKRFKQDEKEKAKREKAKDRSDFLIECFVLARDKTLEAIYDNIKDKFETYYRVIHHEDEDKFTSKLTPDGASLHLEVDFYKRGHFPPHALHSEGHQDSMGLCLFFALNEYLTKSKIKVVVLDDTVMSIDKDHRRAICNLLKEAFSDRQFIITTHDSTWARQLKMDGVVSKRNMIHFVNWNIDVGPIYELEKDLWDRIREDLDKDDVPAAAARLRRNAECFFEEACDLLGASIPYRGDHQWGLGEYATSSVSSFKNYLKKAKASARENSQQDKHKELCELDDAAGKIITRSQIEQWVINANVHYNKWADMGKNDFKPVCEAFKELFELFACSACQQPIALGESRNGEKIVSCNCGEIFWNV